MEPLVGFTCFNFCVKALDSYVHPVLTAGTSGGRIPPPPALTDNPVQALFTQVEEKV